MTAPDWIHDTRQHIERVGFDGDDALIALRGTDRLRWIFPARAQLGLPVLQRWRPYGRGSLWRWAVLMQAYRFGLVGFLPQAARIRGKGNRPAKRFPVIYVGTPGPTQKLVVHWIDAETHQPTEVEKIPVGPDATAALERERQALDLLAGVNDARAPRFQAAKDGQWCQSMMGGQLGPAGLTPAHVEALLALPRSEARTGFSAMREALGARLRARADLPPDWLARLDRVGDLSAPGVIEHGDFAPWNALFQPDGSVALVDWETWHQEGLPLYDLIYFKLRCATLLDRPLAWTATELGLLKAYGDALGLDAHARDDLIFLNLLRLALDTSQGATFSSIAAQAIGAWDCLSPR